MMTLDEMIAVLQAAKDGKKIEFLPHGYHAWKLLNCPNWNFGENDYRVKRDPLELWAWIAHDDLVWSVSTSEAVAHKNAVHANPAYVLRHFKEVV